MPSCYWRWCVFVAIVEQEFQNALLTFFFLLEQGFFGMFSGCMIGGSLYGTGRHLTELTNHQRTTAMEVSFFCRAFETERYTMILTQ